MGEERGPYVDAEGVWGSSAFAHFGGLNFG